jgi:hypothetical protein
LGKELQIWTGELRHTRPPHAYLTRLSAEHRLYAVENPARSVLEAKEAAEIVWAVSPEK